MLKSLGTEFKVGLFAVVAIVTLAYMFFVLSPDTFENKKYNTYYTHLANAAGIVPKTQIKTAGVTIGKVKSVALDGLATKVVFEADATVKMPEGSKIEIRSVGLLGDKHLEVVRVAENGKFVENGGLVPQSTDANDLESVIATVGDIAKDVKKVTATLATVLGGKKGETSVQNIVDNVEGLTADIKATTATLKRVIGDRGGDLNDIVSNVRDGIRDLRSAASVIKGVASPENKERVDHILAQFDATMVDVRGSAKNINLISEKVEKGEGTIGKLVNDDSTLSELEGAIKDIRKVLAPATKLEVDADFHGEYRKDKSSQYWVDMIFRTRPDRYYVLGLTDTTYETDEQTITPKDPKKAGDTHFVQTDKIKHALRFDVQIAKRWYWIAARVGLFQTTGGVATDAYFFKDMLRLTAEAFDWDSTTKEYRRNAHFKAYASVLFYNHIYVMGGLDDMSRTDPATGKARKIQDSLFVGAGLNFSDDDLKAIFGTAALFAR